MRKFLVRHFAELVKKNPEKPLRISNEKYVSLTETGYHSNSPVTMDNRKNPIADEVLRSGKIDLNNPGLSFKSPDLAALKTLSPESLQVDLGTVKVYGSDQILLEDVDPNNIPLDKDIIFWGSTARLVAVGEPTSEKKLRNISQTIFNETKAKHGAKFTWKSYLKLIPFLPFLFYLAIYLEILKEYYYVKSFYTALDRENMDLLVQLKTAADRSLQTQELMAKFYPDNNY